METTFRGVRSSYPVATPHSVRYGGNTSCIEVWAGETCLIIDAGTGIHALSKELIERDQRDIHLLISHTHWDHAQGFPHFDSQHNNKAHIRIYSLAHADRTLVDIFRTQQQTLFYSISIDDLEAQINFIDLQDNPSRSVGRRSPVIDSIIPALPVVIASNMGTKFWPMPAIQIFTVRTC